MAAAASLFEWAAEESIIINSDEQYKSGMVLLLFVDSLSRCLVTHNLYKRTRYINYLVCFNAKSMNLNVIKKPILFTATKK